MNNNNNNNNNINNTNNIIDNDLSDNYCANELFENYPLTQDTTCGWGIFRGTCLQKLIFL